MKAKQDQDDDQLSFLKSPLAWVVLGSLSLLAVGAIVVFVMLFNNTGAERPPDDKALQREREMQKQHHEREYHNK